MCKVIKYGQPLGPYLSSYVLMATAIDRHQAICYPLTYCSWTSRRSRIMVWMAWGAALLFCIPQVKVIPFDNTQTTAKTKISINVSVVKRVQFEQNNFTNTKQANWKRQNWNNIHICVNNRRKQWLCGSKWQCWVSIPEQSGVSLETNKNSQKVNLDFAETLERETGK